MIAISQDRMYDTVLVKERALLVGIDRGNKLWPIGESLDELARLTDTAGAEVVATAMQKLDTA